MRARRVVLSGRSVLFRFAVADVGMRRLAMVALTQAGHVVKTVAQVFEVYPNYFSTLRKTAREQGSGGLVKVQGRPVELSAAQLARARRWATDGVAGQEIARRLQVSGSMISRLVMGGGPRTPEPVQDELPEPEPCVDPEPADADADADADAELVGVDPGPLAPEVMGGPPDPVLAASGEVAGGAACGSPLLGAATVDSRYAGAMLLHAFFDRVGAAAVFAPLTGAAAGTAGTATASGTPAVGPRRFDDVALSTATSMAFALGVGSVEATEHLLRGACHLFRVSHG